MNEDINESHIKDSWKDPEHIRIRTEPRINETDYFHFFDLNEFIKQNASRERLLILDYGAGSSPYRGYFPEADYRKADVIKTPDLYYQINPDSTVPESDETFDLILSTQVVEHVINPDVYFKECFRLLKPGGKLILTTHGVWEEHGVPYDFQRWTEQGMRRDLKLAGFVHPRIFKITCGFRALVFLFTRTYFIVEPPRLKTPKLLFKVVRFIYSRLFPLIYRFCDNHWPNEKVVEATEDSHSAEFYIVIAAVTQKN